MRCATCSSPASRSTSRRRAGRPTRSGVAIVDNYWQTETGWPILSAQPGVEDTPRKFGSPSFPVYGYDVRLLRRGDRRAKSGTDEKGVLDDRAAAAAGLHDAPSGATTSASSSTYFETFPDELVYSTFDWATRDADGYYFVLGRTDDVINVAGHRLGTREIEEAVQAHAGIAEVAVVGVADPVKGQVPVAFAVVKDPARVATRGGRGAMRKEVMDTVDRELGAIARPGAGAFRHAAAEDALGQAPAPLDPGAGRRARSRATSRRSRTRRRWSRSARCADRRASATGGDNLDAVWPRRSLRLDVLSVALLRPRMPRSPLPSRGGAVESVHYGSVAVVDRDGRLLYAAGDPEALTFTRSALKPLQALPFVAGGGVERFGFTTPQVALLCASHSGEPRHVEARRRDARQGGQRGRRPAVRHARAGLLRRARRGAAAAAVFAARAQLLGQAQRHARATARMHGCAQARLPRVRPSAAAGDPRARWPHYCRRARRTRCVAGDRRLLGAELRDAARASRARVRAARAPERRRRVRHAPAAARATR